MYKFFQQLMRKAGRQSLAAGWRSAVLRLRFASPREHSGTAAERPRADVPYSARTTGAATSLPDSSVSGAAVSIPDMPQPHAGVFGRSGGAPAAGEFRDETHSHLGLTRRYKLYIPSGSQGKALPLLVMLHGCTQDPDDFAAGTGMNELADEHGFYVLYPRQSLEANPSRCWNWFNHHHQQRDRGEPALIADLAMAVATQYGLDRQRIYIAGLSAGGAMAAIVAAAYPEIFAAAGVHSGLARGSAGNVLEALEVMKHGHCGAGPRRVANGVGFTSAAASARAQITVPTIVFHGDADETVHPSNGEQVVGAVLDTLDAGGSASVVKGEAAGRRYTHSVHRDRQQKVVAEHWLVHGGGHAWSGGQEAGSHTDPGGPDASREMLRFFFAHPLETIAAKQAPASDIS